MNYFCGLFLPLSTILSNFQPQNLFALATMSATCASTATAAFNAAIVEFVPSGILAHYIAGPVQFAQCHVCHIGNDESEITTCDEFTCTGCDVLFRAPTTFGVCKTCMDNDEPYCANCIAAAKDAQTAEVKTKTSADADDDSYDMEHYESDDGDEFYNYADDLFAFMDGTLPPLIAAPEIAAPVVAAPVVAARKAVAAPAVAARKAVAAPVVAAPVVATRKTIEEMFEEELLSL